MSSKRDLFQKREEITVAGLDLSLRGSGVAILSKEGSYFYTFGEKLEDDASARDHLERVMKISNQIMNVLKKHNVRYVGVENYAFSKAVNRISQQAELGGIIKSQIYSVLKTCVIPLPVNSVRKFILGKSTNDKKVVQKFLKSIGFTTPQNADEYDALAVALVVDFWANKRNKSFTEDDLKVIERMDYAITNQVTAKKCLPI